MKQDRLTPIIHIGLHKTGTTFLQTGFFPKLENVHFAMGWRGIRYVFQGAPSQQIILSDEGFSGRIFGGSWMDDFPVYLERIRNLFGEVKIVIGFREQEKFILSVYKQWLQEGGVEDFSHIFNKDDSGLMKARELMYMPRLEMVKEAFPEVFVYTQGGLKTRFPEFVNSFCTFANLSPHDPAIFKTDTPNIGIHSNKQLRRLISLNKFNQKLTKISPKLSLYGRFWQRAKLTPRYFTQTYMKANPQDKFTLPEEMNEFIRAHYAEDWRQTEAHCSF